MNPLQALRALIRAYQAAVEEAIGLFEKHRELERPRHPAEWIASRVLPQTGFIDLDQAIPYFLHGYGCCVRLPSGSVDWDFGEGGRSDGFDCWRLWAFARMRSSQFPEFPTQEAVEAAFAKAAEQEVIRPAPYILWYLNETALPELGPQESNHSQEPRGGRDELPGSC